jgi:hypothetical protein
MSIPTYPRWLSPLTLIYGITVFLWLTPEDTIWLAAVLGLCGAILIALHTILRRYSGKQFSQRSIFFMLILVGGLIGGGAALTTTGLMFLKTVIHRHVFPDYPLPLLLAMLERAPVWTLAGILVGLACALIFLNQFNRNSV